MLGWDGKIMPPRRKDLPEMAAWACECMMDLSDYVA